MIRFLSKIFNFNSVLVLGVLRSNEADVYHTLTLKKTKDKLIIISASTYSTIDDLLKNENIKKLPLILVADGRGILLKKIDPENEQDVTWKKNIDFSTIYYNEYISNGVSFISFCRKTLINDIIGHLSSARVQVIDAYVGPLASVLLQPVLNTDEINANESVFTFSNNSLMEITKSLVGSKQYDISGITISTNHIALYGAGIHFFVKQEEYIKSDIDNNNIEDIIYKKAFNYFGVAMLVGFFLSLLVSYSMIQYYLSKNTELNQQNVYFAQTYKHIEELEAQKEQKLKILNETGQLSKNFLSYYAYELLRAVPSAIQFNSIDVLPLENEAKENERIRLKANLIFIKGSTASEVVFTQWLSKLKSMRWISKFEIISMKKDKKNMEQFEIKIVLSDV